MQQMICANRIWCMYALAFMNVSAACTLWNGQVRWAYMCPVHVAVFYSADSKFIDGV